MTEDGSSSEKEVQRLPLHFKKFLIYFCICTVVFLVFHISTFLLISRFKNVPNENLKHQHILASLVPYREIITEKLISELAKSESKNEQNTLTEVDSNRLDVLHEEINTVDVGQNQEKRSAQDSSQERLEEQSQEIQNVQEISAQSSHEQSSSKEKLDSTPIKSVKPTIELSSKQEITNCPANLWPLQLSYIGILPLLDKYEKNKNFVLRIKGYLQEEMPDFGLKIKFKSRILFKSEKGEFELSSDDLCFFMPELYNSIKNLKVGPVDIQLEIPDSKPGSWGYQKENSAATNKAINFTAQTLVKVSMNNNGVIVNF